MRMYTLSRFEIISVAMPGDVQTSRGTLQLYLQDTSRGGKQPGGGMQSFRNRFTAVEDWPSGAETSRCQLWIPIFQGMEGP